MLEHKRSPMEFSKGDRFIICSNDYRYRSINADDMKKFISKSKQFIQDMNRIIAK